jgi:molybdopterin molybdotransferase
MPGKSTDKLGQRMTLRMVSVATVTEWIDVTTRRLPGEPVPLGDAAGRVLAEDCIAAASIPETDRAALDGFAVAAEDSVGTSAYNPLAITAATVAAGDAMPAWADAVVPLDHAELDEGGRLVLVEAVAPGAYVEQQGAVAIAGVRLVAARTLLRGSHLALMALAGIDRAAAVRRPSVAMLMLEPPASQYLRDSNGPMIRATITRDGGSVTVSRNIVRDRAAVAAAIDAAEADLVLIIGGTGPGVEDHATAALAEVGTLAIRGVTLRPGETAGFGHTAGGVPVALLPGMPGACLWSYEMLAGRAVRRLAGRDPQLPFRQGRLTLAAKIVSSIGITEICPIKLGTAPDTAEPLPSFDEIGLMAATGGDGFVVVPEASEGFPSGATVPVYLYESLS